MIRPHSQGDGEGWSFRWPDQDGSRSAVMQSSLVTALRSCVMLLSLVAVPLAAVFGSGSWPRVQAKLDELRQELVARLEATSALKTTAKTNAVIEPLVVPAQLASLPGTSQAAPTAPTSPPVPAAPTGHAAPPSGSTPLSNPLPASDSPLAALSSAGQHADNRAALPTQPSAAPAKEVSSPLIAPPLPTHFDPAVRPASYSSETPQIPGGAPPADRAGWIQHRLQTLGADWYRLESLAGDGETFRFQCKMGSPTNPNYVRYFEATSPEPLRAMQHVLDQVDAWVVNRDTPRR